MSTPSPSARAYRRLGYLALAHAIAVFVGFLVSEGGIVLRPDVEVGITWRMRLWIALITLWFFWPLVLALHRGRSALRFALFTLIGAVLLWPSLQFYNTFAPEALGLPFGMRMTPVSAWKYTSAYLAGRREAKKDVSAGILAIEDAGRLPGYERWDAPILRERFKIEIKTIAGSVVDETSIGHRDGYNDVSCLEIDRRFGWNRVDAARDEALQEQYDRGEQLVKELTKRLSSLASDAKITTKLIRPHINGHRLKGPTAEQQLAPFVHAVEQAVIAAVPEDTPAFELNISATLEPNSRPSFQISGSPNSPQPVSQAISNKLDAMPPPEWSDGSLSIAFDFLVRPPR
jgi:hypothetical protein